ncbi:MAG: glycosyltransferase family 1 protein [Chitinophagaceae bacterium]
MGRILIDIERMKYSQHNGLLHYCAQLINAVGSLPDVEPRNITLMATENVAPFYREKNYDIYDLRSVHKFYLPRKSQFDLWHCTYQNSRYFPYTFGGKIVFTIHDFNFMYRDDYSERKKRRLMADIQRKIDHADVVVAISQFVRSEILRYCDIDENKIHVIYNGCNITTNSAIYPPIRKPGRSFFFTVGTILEKKNFKVLPSMLLKNDFQLIIAGEHTDTAYCQKIWEMARRLGVSRRVSLIGSISDGEKNWYLKNCLGLPFTSLTEGFGLPVLEAMHYGKPTFLSKFTSLPEIGGDAAYYFDNFEPEYMAQKTMDDLDHYNTTANRAQEIAEHAGQFSWDEAARKYWSVYQDTLAL